MNKVSSHLYDLIYSLSSSERRYFKIVVKNQIGKHNELCLKLFDLIVRNEGKPIAKIEKKINFTKHPSRLKNYLYELILRSLESYHTKTSIQIKIRKQINQIENLYNKALYDQCIALAKKTLKEAEKLDSQNFKIEILDWYHYALKQIEYKGSEKLEREIQLKQQEAINKLKLEKEYKKLSNTIFNLTKRLGTLYSEEDERRLKEMMDNPFLSDYSLATSFSSKSTFNIIYSGYNAYIGDKAKVKYYSKQVLLLYEDYPLRKLSDQFNYITQLNNYAISLSSLKEYEEADYYFSILEKIQPNNIQIKVKIFEFISANRLDLYLKSGKLKEALKNAEKIEAGLKKYGNKVSTLFKTVTYSNLCYLFFAVGKLKEALYYNNLIINNKNVSFRSDIFRFARIMNLLIHYERNEKLSIEYFFEATKRFINKQNKIYVFEKWFLVFFKDLINLKKNEETSFFKEKELELLNVLRDEKERKALEHFNILAWIRTKVDAVSFEQAILDYSYADYEDYIKKRI